MEKDINFLLGTRSDELFEEQGKLWAGLEVFRKLAWDCKCGAPECFRKCVQGYGKDFPNAETFAIFLERIDGIQTLHELECFLDKFIKDRGASSLN